jgi:hypothetical protein
MLVLTQDWVEQDLDAKSEAAVRAPRVYDAFTIGPPLPTALTDYIVTEYIDASDCTQRCQAGGTGY